MKYFLKLAFSILLGLALLYISFKDVKLSNLKNELDSVNYLLISVVLILSISIVILKSFRYAVLIRPIKYISQKELLPIVTIGLMSLIIIPLRMGEFVRPYLIKQRKNISFTSTTTAVFIERLFEIGVLLFFVFYCVSFSEISKWIFKPFIIMLSIFVFVFILLFFIIKSKSYIKQKIRWLIRSSHIYEKIDKLYDKFHAAFYIFKYPDIIVKSILYTVVIWTISVISIYLILISIGIHLPMSASILIMVVTILGISIPGAPGFVGNYQFANMFALSFYKVDPNKAMLFSIIYYLTNIGLNVLLGVLTMPFVKIKFRDLWFINNKNKKVVTQS